LKLEVLVLLRLWASSTITVSISQSRSLAMMSWSRRQTSKLTITTALVASVSRISCFLLRGALVEAEHLAVRRERENLALELLDHVGLADDEHALGHQL
jgi:hypothetical protein